MSAERIDHAAVARDVVVEMGYPFETTDLLRHAQVHATLALVEQQTLANQIAYVQLLESQYAEAAKHETEFDWDTRAESNVRHGLMLDRIREGLGL